MSEVVVVVGDEIFSESGVPLAFFLPSFSPLSLSLPQSPPTLSPSPARSLSIRHLWLTVLFIGVPVVQGTHLQSLFLCTLSELKGEGDKE